jgi:hypothetical protein
MTKTVSALELTLSSRLPHQTLTDWLYAELRRSILEGGARIADQTVRLTPLNAG